MMKSSVIVFLLFSCVIFKPFAVADDTEADTENTEEDADDDTELDNHGDRIGYFSFTDDYCEYFCFPGASCEARYSPNQSGWCVTSCVGSGNCDVMCTSFPAYCWERKCRACLGET